jgi:transcriptional regulator with XRE-family HTH domain
MANTHPFGQMLHNYRMRAGLTLRNVAEVSGYSEPYLSKIENGLVHPTNTELLTKLSAALQLSKIEEEAFFESAHKSKRYLRLPEGIPVEGYEYAHQFVHLLSDLGSDRSLRIRKFITKEQGAPSGRQYQPLPEK